MAFLMSRRGVIGGLVAAGLGIPLLGQDPGRARDIVDRVQRDLQRAAEFTRNKEKER